MAAVAGGCSFVDRFGSPMLAACVFFTVTLGVPGSVQGQSLASFGVLGGSTVTNTGTTVITGNVGVSPGSAITGFPPGVVTPPYAIFRNDAVAAQAQSDLTTAYNVLASRPTTADLTGQDLGGKTLTAGVYNFNSSAALTGTLTLDAQGDPNKVFIFNIGSTLTTASASEVKLINGANANNVFFRVGSSATLGTTTTFNGRIVALTSITLNNGANITCGAALARNGAVTLDTNVISVVCPMEEIIIGGVVDEVVDGGGELPLGFLVLGLLTPDELAEALAQISGEAGTGFAPTAMEAMDSFLSQVLGHRRGPGVVTAPEQNNTISVMGYAAERTASKTPFSAFDQPLMPAPATWEMWAAVYGGYGFAAGDSEAATHDRMSRHYGIVTGIDYQLDETSSVGFAVGTGATNFDLSAGLGGGHSTMFNAAAYGRKNFDAAYVTAGLAYGFHDVETNRYVTFAGIDHYRAQFGAHNLAGHIEAGYQLGLLTPYVAARGQVVNTPSYDESTVSGSSTFALSYAESTAVAARTEVGVMFDWSRPLSQGTTVGVHAQAAWLHSYGANPSIEATFQAIPGSPFTVEGAAMARDSLLLSLTTEIEIDNGFTLAGSIGSELSSTRQTYAGSVKVGRSW